MATSAISSGTGISTQSAMSSSRQTIAENFDTFLSILTTQLKNQNPLEPLDTNQFTQQLVQFTGVEQQLKTNEFLEALVMGAQNDGIAAANAANQAVNLIGKTIVAGSSVSSLKDGNASWTYTVARDAPNADITIRNAKGEIVHTQSVELKAGQGNFEWDGKDASGLDFDEGQYSITIDAKDATGNPVSVLTQIKGVVDMVDLTGSEPVLVVNGSRIYLDSVLSVTNTPAATDGEDTADA